MPLPSPPDARTLRLAILSGQDDEAVLERARQLGWAPDPLAELDTLQARARRDLDALLAEVSAQPLPFQSNDQPQE